MRMLVNLIFRDFSKTDRRRGKDGDCGKKQTTVYDDVWNPEFLLHFFEYLWNAFGLGQVAFDSEIAFF